MANWNIYDIKTKQVLLQECRKAERIPVKGDYIHMKSFTTDMKEYMLYKDDDNFEVVAVVLYDSCTDVYVDLEKKF